MTPERLPRAEFIALMAMLFATIAFSIDAMLPALPQIGAELSPTDINRAQLVLTSFVLGMGVGTFFAGPLSDSFGRKPILMLGSVIYILSSAAAIFAESLEALLLARALQGVGAAGPRVIGMAIIRDLFKGREMARLMSFVMMVFTLVPALAPTLGAGLIAVAGWRSIFLSFMVFAFVGAVWLSLRQRETLLPEARTPLRAPVLWAALKEIFAIKMVRLAVVVQTICMGMLFAVLSSTQQVFDITFGQGEHFHLWFALIAILAASATVLNAVLVVRLGMRYMITLALFSQIVLSFVMVIVSYINALPPTAYLAAYVLWNTSVFFMVQLTLGNLNALAMEPLGHIAGLAASITVSIATVGAVIIAVPIGLAFDGTPVPVALGVCICAVVAAVLMRQMAKLERVQSTTP